MILPPRAWLPSSVAAVLTRIDYHSATPRHVVLLEADAPEDLAPIAVAGSPHFVCLIVCADPSL